MKRRLFLVMLIGLFPCIVFAGHLYAAERTYNVLFIQSYNHRTPWNDRLTEGVRDGLSRGGIKAKVTTEYLDADYWTFASECVIMRRICERARQKNTDIIITSSDEAFYTLMHCGDSLPYKLPVVISGIKYPNEKLISKLPNVCGYTSKIDFVHLLENARRVFPNRTEVICVSDSSLLGLKGVAELERIWPNFQELHPEYKMKVMNVQSQAPNPVISSICYDYNAYNRIVIAPKWTPFLSFIGKNSKAPVFAGQSLALTNGVFCVHDMEPYEGANAAGKCAAQVLQGAIPSVIGVVDLPGKLLYDFKQLEFFRVNADKVSDSGIIMNAPLMERYRIWFVLFYSVVVGALVFLVIWLYRLNRHESRRRMHAQTRLLIQNRLVEQRDEFDNIFCSIRDGLITYDTDFRIHFVNRALMLMLELDPDTHTARSYEGQMAGSIFHIYSNGEDILQSLLKQVRTERRVIPIPEKAFMQEVHKGTYFPVSGEIVPIYSKNKMTGMAICCRNISEEEMHKRFFNLAVDASSVYPWQYDVRTHSFHFSGALLDYFGLPGKQTILRKELELFIHSDDLEEARQHFTAIFKGEEMDTRMSFRMRSGEGKYEWWEFRSASYNGLDSEAPYMVLGVCQSIQRYKATEEELIAARDKALQADTLKSAFLANMSHEIRTPLNAIVGFSHLMTIADNAEDEKLYSDIINQNSEILLQLINDILDLAKIEAGTLEYIRYPMDLGELCRNVYEMHKDRVQTGVVLILDNKDTSLIINEDQNRIMQVVTNLITNAIKFTFKGEIRFGFEVREEYIDFYVKDTGMGISEEKIKMIFERFVKLNTFVQGTGLGLAICRVIVEKLGGEITAESKLNEGSTFRFTIPYKAGKKIPESGKVTKCPESGSTGPRKVLQRRTVLVAEDVDSNFLLLKTLLGKRCNLLWAKNGEDAVNQFKEHQPDLILMDIKMPHMDGLEATRLIRSYSKEVPIVALTAFAFESDKDRAIEAGCDDFLTKPVSQNALEKVLDKYVK